MISNNYSRCFFGEPAESWDGWFGHFESMARVNDWDENMYLLWLEVQLIEKAHNAWRRVSNEDKAQYSTAKAALWKRFEPDSRRKVYMASFRQGNTVQAKLGRTGRVADKAFPDLEDRAKEQLSFDLYLKLLDKPDVALAVRQWCPNSVDDIVSCTLEIELYVRTFTSRSHHPITSVFESATADTKIVGAVQAKQDAILEMLCTPTTHVDQLEKITSEKQPQCQPGRVDANSDRSQDGSVICRKCKQEGHCARECAANHGMCCKPWN